MAFQYSKYLTKCACGATTSKVYARAHNGKCKACSTGEARPVGDISSHPLLCPDCHEHLLTPYQKAHRYHCDHCTREADPMGYYRELTTPQEPPDPYDGSDY
jgi:hypothetical protein